MQQLANQKSDTTTPFVDRRRSDTGAPNGRERRQFRDSQSANSDVAELADAVDQYKLTHRRRFITYEELFNVISRLGYHK